MKFGFYSCMSGVPWGGSEELWYRTARWLQKQQHQVGVNFKWWPKAADQLDELGRGGGELWFRDRPLTFWETQKQRFTAIRGSQRGPSWVEEIEPDAVLVTLGYHPDRIPVADECLAAKVPYAINVQSASNFFFIHSDTIDSYRRWYSGAKKVFFVSEENQHKVETNLAMKLSNAEIVDNPFNVDRDAKIDWPADDGVFRLACVGRIHFQSKGQDLVVDVMSRPKWRERPIEITFYGKDQGNERQLVELIKMHGLEDKLKLGGFMTEVEDIWRKNHALLLPSRYEGAALVVVESMLCNRVAITTNTGRNSELLRPDHTGFIAPYATIDLLDEALERAWAKREQWRELGEEAGRSIRAKYSVDPIEEFGKRLIALTQ
ncbi:MAG: glycosyltransferase family 4 protein [Pirellulaceae bacterium]|nr:glycosyltransferase family 4 protein [Pirellulaceae bacterium]